MTHRQTAKCPRFIARVDYKRRFYIQCESWILLYPDRKKRDADYKAACCENPEMCPLKQTSSHAIPRAMRSNDKTILKG